MIEKFVFLIMILIPFCSGEEVNLKLFQNDYDVKWDIAECPWYDKSICKHHDCRLVFLNRTLKALNCTFEPLIDMGNSVMFSVQLYKFLSNEYRFFPVTVHGNFSEYKKNSFGIKDFFTSYSNIRPCFMKKGVYYIYVTWCWMILNFLHICLKGSYKMEIQMLYLVQLRILDFYGRVLDKPVDWR